MVTRSSKSLYKYQSRILNPKLGAFPQDRKTLSKLGLKDEELKSGLKTLRRIRVMNEILKYSYGTPSLGNLSDPIDETIYLAVTQRTQLETARRIFEELKSKVPKWSKFLSSPEKYNAILSKAGRGNIRSKKITQFLQDVIARYGTISLDQVQRMNRDEALIELSKNLKLGEKTALCVMIYSLGMQGFPVDSNIIRIINRTRILSSLIPYLHEIGHKKSQTEISKFIPLDIGRNFHINMVVHGKNVCRTRPKCSICNISLFCEYNNKTHEFISDGPWAVDLFAGPGGLSLGFLQCGWNISYAVENDLLAGETYSFNHPQVPLICKDVRDVSEAELQKFMLQKIDLVMAGIPCQGFSLAGYRVRPDLKDKPSQEKDSRNRMYEQLFRIVDIHNPEFVLLENVQGIKTSRVEYNGTSFPVLEAIGEEFLDRNYRFKDDVLDASKYGVPQRRKRVFIIASRSFEPEVIWAEIKSNQIDDGANSQLIDAIQDLPKLSVDDGYPIMIEPEEIQESESEKIWGPELPYEIIYGHISRPHNDQDMRIIRALKPGQTYRQLYDEHPEIFEERAKSDRKVYSLDNFHDKFYRLDPAKPSRTIVSHLAKDGNSYIHPYQNRSITPREAARIQTFPDDYVFWGSRSSQFSQIGNAVPPQLAKIISSVLLKFLRKT